MAFTFCPAGARTKSAGTGSNSKAYTCCLPAVMPDASEARAYCHPLDEGSRPPRDLCKHLPSVSASLRDRVGPQPSMYLHTVASLTEASAFVCIADATDEYDVCTSPLRQRQPSQIR